MTKKMTSPKHQNWTIWKDQIGKDTSWSMSHNNYSGYMVAVYQSKDGQWLGELLTEQKIESLPGETDWLPAQSNPFSGKLEDVKRELVKRAQYWASK